MHPVRQHLAVRDVQRALAVAEVQRLAIDAAIVDGDIGEVVMHVHAVQLAAFKGDLLGTVEANAAPVAQEVTVAHGEIQHAHGIEQIARHAAGRGLGGSAGNVDALDVLHGHIGAVVQGEHAAAVADVLGGAAVGVDEEIPQDHIAALAAQEVHRHGGEAHVELQGAAAEGELGGGVAAEGDLGGLAGVIDGGTVHMAIHAVTDDLLAILGGDLSGVVAGGVAGVGEDEQAVGLVARLGRRPAGGELLDVSQVEAFGGVVGLATQPVGAVAVIAVDADGGAAEIHIVVVHIQPAGIGLVDGAAVLDNVAAALLADEMGAVHGLVVIVGAVQIGTAGGVAHLGDLAGEQRGRGAGQQEGCEQGGEVGAGDGFKQVAAVERGAVLGDLAAQVQGAVLDEQGVGDIAQAVQGVVGVLHGEGGAAAIGQVVEDSLHALGQHRLGGFQHDGTVGFGQGVDLLPGDLQGDGAGADGAAGGLGGGIGLLGGGAGLGRGGLHGIDLRQQGGEVGDDVLRVGDGVGAAGRHVAFAPEDGAGAARQRQLDD